jgi:U4/U6.U5 tri-snRNP-associated protein 2
MASKRERATGDRVEEEELDFESKRQRVDENSSPSPPPVSIANPLSGLANNYADIDEEENYYQRDKGAVSNNRNGGPQQNGHKYEGDDDSDEEDDSGKQLFAGRYSRQVEVRRDCPYLDTVNRQVFYLFCPL